MTDMTQFHSYQTEVTSLEGLPNSATTWARARELKVKLEGILHQRLSRAETQANEVDNIDEDNHRRHLISRVDALVRN
jgi:hypothetical protein